MRDQSITGRTRLVGLLGSPVAHSLSPAIHNHVYATLGLPLAFVPLAVSSENLHVAVRALRACGFAGANATIPHKRAVLPLCDVVSPLSAVTKTVNTLYFRDNLLHGTTTDFSGLLAALGGMGHNPKGGRIVILGNGGTARTFAFAFAREKIPARLSLVGRDEARVRALAEEASAATGFPVSFELFSSQGLADVMRECTLCINCTPVGMHPNTAASPLDRAFLHKDITVFDTVYNPRQTMLCRDAERAGCAWSGGLHMLVHQALASMKFWTGREIDPSIINMDELAGLAETAAG
jgi:shikimate dehydrogenase